MSSSNQAWHTVSTLKSRPQQQATTTTTLTPQLHGAWTRNIPGQQTSSQQRPYSSSTQQSQTSSYQQQRPQQTQAPGSQPWSRPTQGSYTSGSQSQSSTSSRQTHDSNQHRPRNHSDKKSHDTSRSRKFSVAKAIDEILSNEKTRVLIKTKLELLFNSCTEDERGKFIETLLAHNVHWVIEPGSLLGAAITRYYSVFRQFESRGTEGKVEHGKYNAPGMAVWVRSDPTRNRIITIGPAGPDDTIKTFQMLLELGCSPFDTNDKKENIFDVIEVAVKKGKISRKTAEAIRALVLQCITTMPWLMVRVARKQLASIKDKNPANFDGSGVIATLLNEKCTNRVLQRFFELDLVCAQSTDIKRGTGRFELYLFFTKLMYILRGRHFHPEFVDYFKAREKEINKLQDKIAEYYLHRLMTMASKFVTVDVSDGNSGCSNKNIYLFKSLAVPGAVIYDAAARLPGYTHDISTLPVQVQAGFCIRSLDDSIEPEDNWRNINLLIELSKNDPSPSARILYQNALKERNIENVMRPVKVSEGSPMPVFKPVPIAEITEELKPPVQIFLVPQKAMQEPESKQEPKQEPKPIAQLSLAPQKRSFSINAQAVTPVQQLANSRLENAGAIAPAQQLAKTRLENAGALNPDAVDTWGQEIKNHHLGKYGLPPKPVPMPEPEHVPAPEPVPEPEPKTEPELKYESEQELEQESKYELDQEPKPNALSEEQQLVKFRLENAEVLKSADVDDWQRAIKEVYFKKYESQSPPKHILKPATESKSLPPQEPTLKVKSALETLVTGFEGNELERKPNYAETSEPLVKFLQDHSPEEVARQFIVKACANLTSDCVIEHISPYIKYLDEKNIIEKSEFQTLIKTSKTALIESALEIQWDADADTVYAAFEEAVSK